MQFNYSNLYQFCHAVDLTVYVLQSYNKTGQILDRDCVKNIADEHYV